MLINDGIGRYRAGSDRRGGNVRFFHQQTFPLTRLNVVD